MSMVTKTWKYVLLKVIPSFKFSMDLKLVKRDTEDSKKK